ncbi:MAG: methionine--tRNA ligase [Bacilli bacterium]
MNKFISTAIYYSNSSLHIGSAYEIIFADAIARYNRQNGEKVFFMTGMDEHGKKIEETAKQNKINVKKHVDNLANETISLFEHLQISNDYFIRTTDTAHKDTVREIFDKLLNNGDIYLSNYDGNYCISCESFYTDMQLDNCKCPECGKVTERISEESYFLNLKKYEQRLINHIKTNKKFIMPESKKNEILAFLELGLEDLSVTRTSFEWGIKTKNDSKHVIYVWIDALSNYISALKYPDGDLFNEYWNNGDILHVVGKDIVRFHTIYWPIMLMCLDIKLPTTIFSHGFIMMGDDKMSKSKGNVVFPRDYSESYGVDPLRYYLLSELANGNDGSFTFERFIEKYNYDLVNDLSNLVNRCANMCCKYFDDAIVYNSLYCDDYENNLWSSFNEIVNRYHNAMKDYDTKKALLIIWEFISKTNKFIDETEPWKVVNDDRVKLMNILYNLVESLRNISLLISPFINETAQKIIEQFNFDSDIRFVNLEHQKNHSFKVNQPNIIYKRLNLAEEIEKMNNTDPEKKELITIDDFDKLELRVANIVDCCKHPNADKLLLFKLKVGDEERQICSGIAKFYNPSDLIGKNVVIVANLKPVKLRGELSEGMILSAEFGEELNILESIAKSGAVVY